MNEPILSLLGMARRAGKLSLGFEAVSQAVQRGKAKAVFLASDLSPRTERELQRICAPKNIPVKRLPFSIQAITAAVGTSSGTAAVLDNGFASRAMELLGIQSDKGGNAI